MIMTQLWRLETDRKDSTELEHGIPEIMVSYAKKEGMKTKMIKTTNNNWKCISQQCDEKIETVNSALPEINSTTDSNMTHIADEEPLMVEKRFKQSADRECQTAAQTFGFTTLLYTYNCNHAFWVPCPG